jgi:hypothetical protein
MATPFGVAVEPDELDERGVAGRRRSAGSMAGPWRIECDDNRRSGHRAKRIGVRASLR